MKGVIYKIENIIKGYIYIGQTINLITRKQSYKGLNVGIKKQYKVYNSLKKYGWENHTFEVIEECNKELLNEREIYWINHYNSWHFNNPIKGMNISSGGKQASKGLFGKDNKKSKKIYQYDLEGNFIKEWISATEFAKNNNCNQSCISTALNKNTCAYNYKWFSKYQGEKIERHIPKINALTRKIIQLDINGNITNYFDSINDAARYNNIYASTIFNYLKGNVKVIKKYNFKYNDEL
jgi:hypothetical protein